MTAEMPAASIRQLRLERFAVIEAYPALAKQLVPSRDWIVQTGPPMCHQISSAVRF